MIGLVSDWYTVDIKTSMSDEYRNQHYVTQWYQKKFTLPGQHEFHYLNLTPDTFKDSRGIVHTKKPLRKQGSRMCFVVKDLYTTQIRGIETTDIEQHFFGEIDTAGRAAVNYFDGFTYPPEDWGSIRDGSDRGGVGRSISSRPGGGIAGS